MQNRSLPHPVAKRLIETYGAEASKVLALAGNDPSLLRPLAENWPFLRAEIAHAALNEGALTLQDALCRRTPVFFLVPGATGEALYRDAAAIMGGVLGWDAERRDREVAAMVHLAHRHMSCVRPEARPA
jgi:glycerol-3-phosphate dehydrogenase